MPRLRCKNGTWKNKKTGKCEEKSTIRKRYRCKNGTRKNKKTGKCEGSIQKMPNNSVVLDALMHKNWDSIVTKKIKHHNHKQYVYLVIPKNTHVYRGFQYGSIRDEDDFKRGRITKQDDGENRLIAHKEYLGGLNGFFFGTLGVASYYAFNPDNSDDKYNHTVIEYITSSPIYILDMSVWQNIKNVIDDLSIDDSEFNYTYGFDLNNPSKPLKRTSYDSIDVPMIEQMANWMKLSNSPKVDGFGHSKMTGFHSEFMCSRKEKLKKKNEYNNQENYENIPELINVKNPNDIILLKDVNLDDGKRDKLYNMGAHYARAHPPRRNAQMKHIKGF